MARLMPANRLVGRFRRHTKIKSDVEQVEGTRNKGHQCICMCHEGARLRASLEPSDNNIKTLAMKQSEKGG